MKIMKQSVGIDISKDFLECCLGSSSEDQQQTFTTARKFANTQEGFNELVSWVNKHKKSKQILYVMEATGVYYENLAYWLYEKSLQLSVLLPNKVNHFAKSHNIKTKTDWVDAKLLSIMGLERELQPWTVTSTLMRNIKSLTREYRELKTKTTCAKNQLHAKTYAYSCPKSTQRRLKQQIKLLERYITEVEAELRVLIMGDSLLCDKIERLETIPGVRFMTIMCVLGETNAFALVRNAKQLVSYCGLDIRHKQSGIKEGKTAISKKGNSFIRGALYMPALSASVHNPSLRGFYLRLAERKPVKKIAVTAVARKLLILIYVLWKNETVYEANYAVKKPA